MSLKLGLLRNPKKKNRSAKRKTPSRKRVVEGKLRCSVV